VFRCGEKDIVGDASWGGTTGDGREGKKWCQWSVGREVKVDVDTTVIVEEEVAQSVDTLDGIWVG
jgi:hypothetical protein